jgi:hypothetical protein
MPLTVAVKLHEKRLLLPLVGSRRRSQDAECLDFVL